MSGGEKWMTSGRARLKARQNRTFPQRASLERSVTTTRASRPTAPSSEAKKHPRYNKQNKTGLTGSYSEWADPIARRAVVVTFGNEKAREQDAYSPYPPGTVLASEQRPAPPPGRRIRDANRWQKMRPPPGGGDVGEYSSLQDRSSHYPMGDPAGSHYFSSTSYPQQRQPAVGGDPEYQQMMSLQQQQNHHNYHHLVGAAHRPGAPDSSADMFTDGVPLNHFQYQQQQQQQQHMHSQSRMQAPSPPYQPERFYDVFAIQQEMPPDPKSFSSPGFLQQKYYNETKSFDTAWGGDGALPPRMAVNNHDRSPMLNMPYQPPLPYSGNAIMTHARQGIPRFQNSPNGSYLGVQTETLDEFGGIQPLHDINIYNNGYYHHPPLHSNIHSHQPPSSYTGNAITTHARQGIPRFQNPPNDSFLGVQTEILDEFGGIQPLYDINNNGYYHNPPLHSNIHSDHLESTFPGNHEGPIPFTRHCDSEAPFMVTDDPLHKVAMNDPCDNTFFHIPEETNRQSNPTNDISAQRDPPFLGFGGPNTAQNDSWMDNNLNQGYGGIHHHSSVTTDWFDIQPGQQVTGASRNADFGEPAPLGTGFSRFKRRPGPSLPPAGDLVNDLNARVSRDTASNQSRPQDENRGTTDRDSSQEQPAQFFQAWKGHPLRKTSRDNSGPPDNPDRLATKSAAAHANRDYVVSKEEEEVNNPARPRQRQPNNLGAVARRLLIGSPLPIRCFDGEVEVDLDGNPLDQVAASNRQSTSDDSPGSDSLDALDWNGKSSLWG